MAVTLDSLKKTIGKKNVNSRAFAWLADLEREAGNLDQALQRVDGGLTLYPNDIAAMLVRSKILFQKESYDACIEECEKVLVADPFNLAAQQIMGDAYDKLENIGERNACYRRLHDMDPLNTFWKDEYDVVVGAAAAAAMAGEISDTDFSMPDVGNVDLSDEFTAGPAAEPAATVSADEFKSDEPQVVEADSSSSDAVETTGDDPFAALASMLPGNEDADDSAMEDLSASLNSAMDAINNEASAERPLEEMGEDDNISSSDVGSALSDMFGLEDDLEPEEASGSVSETIPAADIPASIDDNAEANAASIFGSAASEVDNFEEDKPQSIDDAFGDIFGEDELPEEKPQQASIDAPADESAPVEDKPQSIDDAFGDIFGDDELPEEKPQASIDAPAEESAAEEPAADIAAEPTAEDLELPSEDGGLFEKSADADMNLASDWTPGPSSAVEDEPTTVDNAFDSIFGEDELPEEKPQASIDAPAEEPAADIAAEPTAEDLELPTEEGGLFEKSADADMNLTGDWTPGTIAEEETPAIEDATPAEESVLADDNLNFTAEEIAPVAEEAAPAEQASVEQEQLSVAEEPAPAPASDAAFSVDNAFDSLFGSDDDLPEEKPQAEEIATPAPEETVSLAEQVDKAEAELEMPEIKSEETDLAKEMGGAFASMFGNDDDLDLPAEKPETSEVSSNDQEATGAAIEESFANVSEESLSKDLNDTFDNLFGKDDASDDSLSLDDSKPNTAENSSVQENVAEASMDAPKDLDSLESEVSGAFKGLFDMDDDSLTEEDKPSNKGVDFLMSGDSDDEISAGLINNPDAPLDRGAYDLDESLNTPTLAEIYFDQGKYGKALEIYRDLAQKEPDNEEIAKRKDEIEKLYNEKFGGNA